jgi:hypothetical protein
MPMTIALSTSKAKYMATCSAPLATAHIYSTIWHTLELNNGVNLHIVFQLSHLSSWLIIKPLYRLPAMEN